LDLVGPRFDKQRFSLYTRYIEARHGGATGDIGEYRSFLLEAGYPDARSSVDSGLPDNAGIVLSEYRLVSAADRLLAVGYLDVLPDGLSSIFFTFEPEESRRSLGTLSVYWEAEAVFSGGRTWYYLGFWVPGARKMDYKADFAPFDLAMWNGRNHPEWLTFPGKATALEALVADRRAYRSNPPLPRA
jgi:arginyl-tRNA--protein-N-Asp/Glu arginylyltransferase